MSQHDYDVNSSDSVSGLQFRSDVNAVLSAIKSSNSGATAPTTFVAGTLWLDTSTTPHILKKRNTANDGWDTIRIEDTLGASIPSATTTTVGTYSGGNTVHITGIATITSLGVSTTGTTRTLIFDNALTITHNATSLILLGGANILTVAGSVANFICEDGALGYWRCTAISHSAVSMAELLYISTLTSDAQTQLNSKQATLTFDAVPTNASTNPVESNGIFDALALKAPLTSPALTGVPTAPTAANGTNTTQLATTAFVLANGGSGSVSGIRQTVQSGSVDTSGFANFISIGTGLNVNIAATTTPIKVHAAGGAISADRLGTISADKTLLLPASSTSYIYEAVATDGTCTSGSTTLAPIYQFGGTPAVTNGQFTYNISEGKGYLGNGTTAPQVWIVFTGEAITDGSAVTSVVTYALNGMYDSGYTATLPAATVAVSKNHNIGTNILKCHIEVECTTTDAGFAVGDIFENVSTVGGGAYPIQLNIVRSNKVMSFKTGDSGGGWYVTNKGTGALAGLTLASWKYKLIAQRGF